MSLAAFTRISPEPLNTGEPSKMSFTKRVGQFLSDHKIAVLRGSLVIGLAYFYVEFFQGPVCYPYKSKDSLDIYCHQGVFLDSCRLSTTIKSSGFEWHYPAGTDISNLSSCLETLRSLTQEVQDKVLPRNWGSNPNLQGVQVRDQF